MPDSTKLLERFTRDASVLLDAVKSQRIIEGNEECAKRLIAGMTVLLIAPGEKIIEQGGADNDLYLILAGKFNIVVNGRILTQRGPGEQVGEMAAAVSFLRR